MQKTKIEWVLNPDGTLPGYSWSPITGCLKGCEYCYARRLANTRLRGVYLKNMHIANPDYSGQPDPHDADPFYPRFWPEKLKELPRYDEWTMVPSQGRNKVLRAMKRGPRGIFVCNMGDLFGKGVPEEWTHSVLDAIRHDTLDRFYLLTKQPQNLAAFSPFPDNAWVGVSITDRFSAYSARDFVCGIKARVKFLSIEPLLGHMDGWALSNVINRVKWLIIGAQTKPTVLPQKEWVEEIEAAAEKAGLPVFEKDSLAPLFPERALRKEWPK